MKRMIVVSLLLLLSNQCLAASLTPQEQEMLTSLRELYSKQIGRQPTPEEEQKMLEQWRATSMNMLARLGGLASLANGGAQQAAAQQGYPTAQQQGFAAQPSGAGASITEEALAQRLAALGPAKPNLKIEGARDGLKIGGATFLDPEGQIKTYAYDVLSGDISYTVRTGDGLSYKYLRAGSDAEPVTFATGRQSGAGWQVNTVTGKTFSGDTAMPLARGFIVARAGSLFRYEPGKGAKGAAVPEGWNVTPFQRGNVGVTRYVMLERAKPADETRGSLASVINSFKSLGAVAGLSKKEDYALMHLDSGKLHLLNVQVSGKNRTVMGNCRKRNNFVNDCDSMTSFESLYSDTGRNFGHYYWKADWYATPSGPIAVTMENGVADVYVLDLDSGKKVSAFHRGLGISTMDVAQAPDGTVAIKANWAFEDHQLDDAVKFLRESTAVAESETTQR